MRSTGHPGHEGTDVADADVDFDGRGRRGRRGPGGSVLTRAVCVPIKLYRALSAHRLPHCRYLPSCSAYALESVEVHGVRRGLWLAMRRLARCHPWGGFGADPVPGASA
jgi:putative membrane protein insertion efficiency factor